MKLCKASKKLVSFLLIFVLILTLLPTDTIKADDDVVISVNNVAQADILLSRGRTRVNTDNFENDLRNSLQSKGIDTTHINFIHNDSVKMDAKSGFSSYNWKHVKTNGGYFYYLSDTSLSLVGDTRNEGQRFLYTSLGSNPYKFDIKFTYSLNVGDSFNGAGVLVSATDNGNGTATGILLYLFSSNNNSTGESSNLTCSGLYRVTYNLSTGYLSECVNVASLNVPYSGSIELEVNNEDITARTWSNSNWSGSTAGIATASFAPGPLWGYFSSHYSHDCSMIGNFTLGSLTINIETSKEFKKILTEEQDNWTSGYTHIMVNCTDSNTEPTFDKSQNSDNYYSCLNLLNVSDIHFVQWGTSANYSLMQNYINQLPNGGRFFDLGSYDSNRKQMTNYWNCIDATATYIADLIKQSMNSEYVIIDRPTSISVNPNSARQDNNWSFTHDISKLTEDIALDNDLGYSDYQGSNNITFPNNFAFDKPGQYYIYYKGKLVKKVTAHRLPTAIINMSDRTRLSSTMFRYSFNSSSFDIDSNSNTYGLGKGIKSLKWEYRQEGGNWNTVSTAINASVDINTDYNTDIRLTVTDFLNASSSTVITINNSSKPVAYFSFASNPVSLYENINVIDSSYDPLGRRIVESTWTLKKLDGSVIYSGSTAPNFTPQSKGMGIGTYKLSLKVKNEAGIESYIYTSNLVVKRVVSYAIYDYNWKDGNHGNYNANVQTEYLNVYPNLEVPTKYYTIKYDKTTGSEIDRTYDNVYATFNGWFKDSNFTKYIQSGVTKVTSTGNHYIYAKWTTNNASLPNSKKIYTVYYNGNGNAIDAGLVDKSSDTETWTFKGWYTSSQDGDYIGTRNTDYNVKKNQTLYAQWQDNQITLTGANKDLTISYNANGGSSTLNKDTKKSEFKGWYTSQNGGTYVGTKGDKYTVNNNHTLYAHWGNSTFVLPDAQKDGYTFVGWFDKPQTNDIFNNTTNAHYIGKAGTSVTIDSSRTYYAWYNSKPVFNDTAVPNTFYEGQTINGADLIKLVSVKDKENDNLTINLVDVTYKDGTKVPFDREKILDTKTDNIGKFFVKYTVTDYGIEINGNIIEFSPVTVEYVRECEIRYNDLPSIKTEPYLYTYTGDKTLTKDTIEAFVKSYVNVNDYQDDIDNRPWWNAAETKASLINNIEVVKVTDIQLNSAYVKDNAEFANTIKSINSLQGIYSLKETAPDAFNAITSYNVVFDVKDQWGKYTSDRLSDEAIAKGVKPSERDKTQTDSDRSVLVICTNDASYNNAYDGLRYVSSKYIDTVNANSYWGDYGKSELRNILDTREKVYAEEDIEPTNTYVGVYKKKNGNSMKIVVNDYTK